MRFGELVKDNKGTSDDFKALRKDCAAYEKERKALTGTEAQIAKSCDLIENLIKTLDSKGISVSVRRDSAVVGFRNLDKAVLTLSEYNGGKKGKVINTWNLANKASSFYVVDKEKIALPSLDDGEYLLKVSSGKETSETIYEQFNLSIATTTDADGIKVYVADYLGGDECALLFVPPGMAQGVMNILLSYEDLQIVGLEGYGLEIVENVPVEVTPNKYNERYLHTKQERMGHILHFNK